MARVSIGKADLKPGHAKLVKVKDLKLALFNIGGKYYCINGVCTHKGGPLWDGDISDSTVTCPWHGSIFDCKSGKVLHGPAAAAEKSYKVTEKKGELFINL